MPDQDPTADIPSVTALHCCAAAIAQALHRAKRAGNAATLIAVSKTHAADAIAPLLQAGHRQFGENRVQEAAAKWPDLRAAYPGVVLHLIGALQSNKAEAAVALFDAIHTLDRESLATALARAMDTSGRRPQCFVQVNTGAEAQKSGCSVADLPNLLAHCQQLGLPVVGLMCLPPVAEHPAPHFALLHKLAARHGLTQLSMGMSDDFEIAVQLGATHVRVGSRIFGSRPA